MPIGSRSGVGDRIAYYRSVMRPKMTQQQLADAACVSVGAIRKIEQGDRGISDATLESIADALGVDSSRLRSDRGTASTPVHEALPLLSAVLLTHEFPEDGPVRPLDELRIAVASAERWRLAAQYARIARQLPALLSELARSHHQAPARDKVEIVTLLVKAYRAADAVAYKFGAHDLSARMVDLMRRIAPEAGDSLLSASVAYVSTETFFAARAHAAGLRALEQALAQMPTPTAPAEVAARGALHMRAAVIAGRASAVSAAHTHLAEAAALAARVREGVYHGTAFGPDSVRIHEVSVAVSLGHDHVSQALDVAREWKPPSDLPAERRSGFYIELARAQLWSGKAEHAFESLKVARHIAPQHTREHPWVREDAATLRRLKRADAETLTNFAEWCAAT
ncbi:helix-turn-helix domain-containing protein [Streptomyces sp. NPDC002755]|uniref:helix-turn-helix domain-containing protein n=1 Tax=Streptomyces sp. NPDC002884 TaxID=3154544 RepID=UPI00331B1ACC